MQQEYGPKRSRETTKPRAVCPELTLYYCRSCGCVFQAHVSNNKTVPVCCSRKMEPLESKDANDVSEDVEINYKITGGYNDNAVEVSWKINNKDVSLEWVYLRTFTGGQLKYVTNPKKPYFVFALADEDAYAYCDEDPCLECTFRCKRGFEIYAYIKEKGLIKIPLDRMRADWRS